MEFTNMMVMRQRKITKTYLDASVVVIVAQQSESKSTKLCNSELNGRINYITGGDPPCKAIMLTFGFGIIPFRRFLHKYIGFADFKMDSDMSPNKWPGPKLI